MRDSLPFSFVKATLMLTPHACHARPSHFESTPATEGDNGIKERERQSRFKDVSTERTAWDAHETIGENESLLFNFDHIKMRRKTARRMAKISKRIAPPQMTPRP